MRGTIVPEYATPLLGRGGFLRFSSASRWGSSAPPAVVLLSPVSVGPRCRLSSVLFPRLAPLLGLRTSPSLRSLCARLLPGCRTSNKGVLRLSLFQFHRLRTPPLTSLSVG
ncbi:hypothetical protein NDU88_007238 [Pleurodeles waltl]|uniref:Uncharacterized protein n=1 Tax=Pleurodeles waltl TaxID=8319 RepID=A0AAV7WHZ5_PLEWA|nr:hypothetical protein NDU88_007238 [Pleurodeles waltl]